jgi:hypothetical protein
VVAACGGDNNSNSPAAPTTVTPAPAPAPTPRLVQQGTMNLSAPKDDTVHFSLAAITDNTSGRWETTVDWTDQANELWMWVANGAVHTPAIRPRRLPVRGDLSVSVRHSIRGRHAEAAGTHHSPMPQAAPARSSW